MDGNSQSDVGSRPYFKNKKLTLWTAPCRRDTKKKALEWLGRQTPGFKRCLSCF